MRSYFDLFLYSFVILQCFRFYAVNGECCKTATLGLCGYPSTFRPNFCADCSAGDPHCGVGECNADGCDCKGGCRTGKCVAKSECDPHDCDPNQTQYIVPGLKAAAEAMRASSSPRPKRQSSDAQLTGLDEAAAIIQMMDTNQDGKLSLGEIYNSAKVRKINLSNATFDEEFKTLDADHDGFLTVSEIHLLPENKSPGKKGKLQKRSGQEIIREADKNGDGALDMTEAYEYFSTNGRVKLNKSALEAEIKSLDKNRDGLLSEAELDPKNSSII